MNDEINNLLYEILDEEEAVSMNFLVNEWRKLNVNTPEDAKIILKAFVLSTVKELCLSEGYPVDNRQLRNAIDGNLVSYTGSVELVLLINNINKALNYVINAGLVKTPLTNGFVYNVYTIVANGITKNDFDYYKNHMFRSKAVSDNMRAITSDLRRHCNKEDVLDMVSYLLVRIYYLKPFNSFNFTVSKLISVYYMVYNGFPPILFNAVYDTVIEDCVINAVYGDELSEVTDVLKYLLEKTMEDYVNYNNSFNKRLEDYLNMEVNNNEES